MIHEENNFHPLYMVVILKTAHTKNKTALKRPQSLQQETHSSLLTHAIVASLKGEGRTTLPSRTRNSCRAQRATYSLWSSKQDQIGNCVEGSRHNDSQDDRFFF